VWHSLTGKVAERKDCNMPEMFDWIFYAIVVLPVAYLAWDWFKDR
jgi:hypothetical protein